MPPSRVDRPARDRDDRPRHRRERETYRFAEVVPGLRLTLLDGLATATGALLAGTVVGFFALLGLTLVGGELVPGARYEADEVMRTTLGWWVLALAVTVPAHVPLRAAATLALATAVLDGRPRTDVPPWSVRRRVSGSNPPGALAGLAWTYLALALVAGGAVAPFAMDRDAAERAPVIAVSAVVAAAAVVLLLALPVRRARWTAAQGRVRTTWGPNEVRLAEAAERRRRAALDPGPVSRDGARRASRDGRAATVLGASGLVGLGLLVVGLWMRHPRKFGPNRYYGPVGETSIDVLAGVGGALVVGALLLGAAWLLVRWARGGRDRRESLLVLRSSAPSTSSAPPADDVVQALLSPWSAPVVLALVWLVGTGLVVPSVLAGATGGGVALVVDGVPFVPVALAVLVATVGSSAVVVDGVARAAHRRTQVRARWHPGDDGSG